MATVEQIQASVDNFLDNIWPDLVSAQDAYFALHGTYIQLLPTPETLPAEGATVDFTIRLDPLEQWGDDFSFTVSTKIPCQIAMSNFGNNTQHGFTVYLAFSKDEIIYKRQKTYSFGDVDTAWYQPAPPF
jgi:hypothetical protein